MEPNEVHPDVREVIAELSENYIRGTCGHKVEIDRLRTALASRDAEIEELRADVVWAVRHGVSEGYDGNSDPAVWYSSHKLVDGRAIAHERMIQIDGTDADIRRAVREARKG